MKSINDYNKVLKHSDHRIFAFRTEVQSSFILAKMGKRHEINPEDKFIVRTAKQAAQVYRDFLGLDIEKNIYETTDYAKLCKEADALIKQYGSSRVGA
jgi:hypothetical protein